MSRTLVAISIVAICFMLTSKVNADISISNLKNIGGNFSHTTVIATTNYGLIAGQHDTRGWLNPYNGVYISPLFNDVWDQSGLKDRYITDLYFTNDIMYATTKYSIDGKTGSFYSTDSGISWNHISGANFPANTIAADETTVLVGGMNKGLWIGNLDTAPFTQVIGSSTKAPNITHTTIFDSTYFALEPNVVHISEDSGTSWTPIASLTNKRIDTIAKNRDVIYAGSATQGLFISRDGGNTFNLEPTFLNTTIKKIKMFKGRVYVGTNTEIYFTEDQGVSWHPLGLNSNILGHISDIEFAVGTTDEIYIATTASNIYKANINYSLTSNKFMSLPWTNSKKSDLDLITSYFDHRYPLLGYSKHTEPSEYNKTTMNFFGIEKAEPSLYYSSHNGIDFALPYGHEVKAVAAGEATYYYCNACGHTIKINHQNGYQSTYMHLQDKNLITKTTPVWVSEGTTIGLIGMTGNTTGPHLHFTVHKDKNNNGNFDDDKTIGVVDPYGWQSEHFQDPWALYTWEDSSGIQSGMVSAYLWDKSRPTQLRASSDAPQFSFENIVLKPLGKLVEHISTIFIRRSLAPKMPLKQQKRYIPDTSFTIEVVDKTNNKIENFTNETQVSIQLDTLEEDVDLTQLSLEYFDEEIDVWVEPTNQHVDLIEKKITATIPKPAQIAVFEQIQNILPPVVEVFVSQQPNDLGFYESPIKIVISASENATIFHKFKHQIDWEMGEGSVETGLNNTGIYKLEIRTKDKSENWTHTEKIIKLNTSQSSVKRLEVKETNFSVQN